MVAKSQARSIRQRWITSLRALQADSPEPWALRWKRGDYAEAVRVTTGALAQMEGDKNALRDVSKAHNILGLISQSRGDYDGALVEFRKSLDIDTRTGEYVDRVAKRS